MSTVIQIENLSKHYYIQSQKRERYTALRDVLTNGVRSLWNRVPKLFNSSTLQSFNPSTKEEFWALKDINLEIHQGDRVGIIGRNGAGKSTLLKILSRITEPTTGQVRIKGRVASLLEVGTGFHPELTGRENIYLNGAILGMSRADIRKTFDEIVTFAEIEKFLDTPVKHYSSGMYVRLAFAVAAHLEPEILIVDEVLAVGDAQFQKKCLGKMKDVSAKEGRTILFVSHNMQAIRQLCSRAILLKSGALTIDSQPSETIGNYLQDGIVTEGQMSADEIIKGLPPDPTIRFESIGLIQNGQPVTRLVENGKTLEIEIYYRVLERTSGLRVYIDLCDDQDMLIFRSFHDENNDGIPIVEPGEYCSKAVIPADMLAPVRYELRVLSTIFNIRYCVPAPGIVIPINVEHTGRYNRAYLGDTVRGKLALKLDWTTIQA